MTPATQPSGSAFTRSRATKTIAGIASAGVMAGLSLVGATSASAVEVTDADCLPGNTVDSAATSAPIQALIDANVTTICLSGTSIIDNVLSYSADLTLYGIGGAAVLDSDGAGGILQSTSGSTLTVLNLRLTNASAPFGAIDAQDGGTVVVRNSAFDNNSGDNAGGAISAYTVDIAGSTFTDNTAGYAGGAVYAQESATVATSTFTHNTSGFLGGAIASYGVLTVDASTFDTNEANYLGGATYSNDELMVTNSTFVDNTAQNGGAIAASVGSVVQSTFLDNVTDEGMSQSIFKDDSGELDLLGNIFAGDSGTQLGGSDGQTFTDLGGNMFSTAEATETSLAAGTTAFEVTKAQIFDGAGLADNGGPTQTVALYAGSPAVNYVTDGDPSITTDQRGVARDALPDSGAYEFAAAVSPAAPPALAATGSAPAGWLGGVAALLLAGGALALGVKRRARSI